MASLDEVNEYMENGNYKSAIEALDDIIANEPNNARAFYLRGKATFIEVQNNNEKSSGYDAKKALIYSTIEYDLNKAISIDPSILDAYKGLMYLNRDLGNIEKEREFAQILLEKDNTEFDALILLARSYLNNGSSDGDFHQAIGFYTDFIELKGNEDDAKFARFERGLCYYNLNILESANEEANILIQEYPFYDDAYYLKGLILSKYDMDSEEYNEALFFFDKAIEISPDYFGAVYERAKWYYNKDEYRKSIEDYNYILASNPERVDAMLGKVQTLHDFITENEDEEYPDSEEGGHDLQECTSLLNYILDELKIESNQFKYYRANLYAYQGELTKAIEELKNVINNMEEVWSWLYEKIADWIYRCSEKKEEYSESLSFLKKIKEEDINSYTSYLIARSAYDSGEYETAVKACEKFFLHEETEDSANMNWIYAESLDMINSKDYELIIKHLKKCLEEIKEGFIYLEIGRVMLYNAPHKYAKEGVEMLEKAIELKEPFAMHILSQQHFYGKNVENPDVKKAIELAKRSFKEDETVSCPLTLIGHAYELGRGVEHNEKKAFKYYEKAYNIAKKNNSFCTCANAALAHSYFMGIGVAKDENKAIDIVLSVIKEKGKDSNNDIMLLYAYFALNNYEGFDMNKALELLENEMPYPSNVFLPMMLKRLYKKLKKQEKQEEIENIIEETLKRGTGIYDEQAKKYLDNFDIFYPMLQFIDK